MSECWNPEPNMSTSWGAGMRIFPEPKGEGCLDEMDVDGE
jgi:hypothetical protein